MVKYIRNLTHLMEDTTLIALLQPTPETFELFDDVLLLSEGELAQLWSLCITQQYPSLMQVMVSLACCSLIIMSEGRIYLCPQRTVQNFTGISSTCLLDSWRLPNPTKIIGTHHAHTAEDAQMCCSLASEHPAILDSLWNAGQIIYHGPRTEVLPFFAQLGFRCPPRKGTADFLQEVISKKDQQVSLQWHELS